MEIFQSPPKSGKTTSLIQACATNHGLIVCESHTKARKIWERARRMGLNIAYPITFDEFLGGSFSHEHVTNLYIDDVDELLFQLAKGAYIAAITLTQKQSLEASL